MSMEAKAEEQWEDYKELIRTKKKVEHRDNKIKELKKEIKELKKKIKRGYTSWLKKD